jgi:GNAT superfamily N-acetyltransferase
MRPGGRFHIAPARPPDLRDLRALIHALARYESLESMCVSTEADLADALFGRAPAAEALIARDAGESGPAAGFALFFHTFSTFEGRRGLWLEDLFVRPEYRGAGLGRTLLVRLAGIARDRGCARFEWSVLDWNAPAIGFYERLGAVLMSDWRIARVAGPALEQLAAGPEDPPPH